MDPDLENVIRQALGDALAAGPDPDIYRSANVLVKHHGQDAPIQAAMRADAMLDKGDLDGYAVWQRIGTAVEELLSKERPDGATLRRSGRNSPVRPRVSFRGRQPSFDEAC